MKIIERDGRRLLDIIRTGNLSDDERADIYLLGVMDAIRTLKYKTEKAHNHPEQVTGKLQVS